MKTLKILSILVLFTTKLFSQTNIPNTTTVVENFNTMSTSTTTALPSSWRIHRSGTPTFTGGTQNLTSQASSGSPVTGSTYNWGNSVTTTDRCPGVMTSGSFASPSSLIGWYRNTNTNNLTSLNISYTLERYRINTAAASVTFFYSTDGSTWTAVTSGDISSGLTTGTSSYNFNPSGTPSGTNCGIISKTGISITGLTITNNSSIYLRWNLLTTGSNSQGIGIDDINVTATFGSTPTATITGAATTSAFTTTYGTESTPQSFSISGSNLTASITATAPTGFEVSNDGITYGSTKTFTQSSGTASGTLRIRLKSNASATGTYNSNNIVLSSTGASSVNITTPSTGNSVSTKTLTISGISFTDKAYDGTTTTTLSGIPSYVGLVNSESFSVSGSVTWAFSSVNVGSAISITRTGSYSAPSTNYTVTQPTGFTANIIKANQTITFNNLPFKSLLDVDFVPDAVSSVGLALTLTSSNTSIATIVSNKVHIVGNGTCTITASQAGNTNCFPATDVSKTLIVKSPTSRWSFESVTVNNTGTTPNFGSTSRTADIGDLTTGSQLTGFHSLSSTWSCGVGGIVGNGSNRSLHVTNWSVGDYFQFQLNTTYYDSLLLTVEQTSSATGPRDFKLQYSLNGTSYTDITTYQVPYYVPTLTVHSWSSTNYQSQSAFSFDLSSLTQIHNQSLVYFRLVNTTTTGLLGGTIQTAGTSRIDNISIMGNYNAPLDLEGWIRNNPKPEYTTKKEVVSDCDEPPVYYDFIGREVKRLEVGKIYIKKSCGQSERFMITE
jgi:hypothetical protein